MELLPQEKIFYRDLFNVINEPIINELLVKYAQNQYNNAVNKLKKSKDLHEIGYFQGQINVFESIINIKETIANILKGS